MVYIMVWMVYLSLFSEKNVYGFISIYIFAELCLFFSKDGEFLTHVQLLSQNMPGWKCMLVPVLPSLDAYLIFPFHLLPPSAHLTRFFFWFFTGFLAIFILISSNKLVFVWWEQDKNGKKPSEETKGKSGKVHWWR